MFKITIIQVIIQIHITQKINQFCFDFIIDPKYYLLGLIHIRFWKIIIKM